MQKTTSKQLTNGIRLVHYLHSSPVAHCGLLVNAGSRDENGHPQGIAHFMEHMLFKGTERRKTRHILSRIDEVGGELNAYTTKENTFIYASFLRQHLERAIDIIHDISFHSSFPEKEIAKERAVIIDELHSYKDDPSEEINDTFDEVLFGRHALGSNILGTLESVSSIKRSDIVNFHQATYHTDEMVFCYLGDEPAESFFRKAEQYFTDVPAHTRSFRRKKFVGYNPGTLQEERSTHTCHCVIGNVAYGIKSPKRLPFFLLNNILGGPGLNSRLNMNIREKYGYTYFLDSTYTPFEETGEWTIYLATDRRNLEKAVSLVYKELQKLREKPISTAQLSAAKTQLKGQLALSNEHASSLLHVVARSYLLFNRMDTLEDIYRKIDRIESNDLLDIANEIMDPEQLSRLTYISV